MTPAQSKWLDEMETLFQSPGWATFISDQQGYLDAIAGQWKSHKTFDTYQHDKGRAEVHESIINLHTFVDAARKSLNPEIVEDEPEQY